MPTLAKQAPGKQAKQPQRAKPQPSTGQHDSLPEPLRLLQRYAGNQAVMRMMGPDGEANAGACGKDAGPSGECDSCRRKRLQRAAIQTKLTVSEPGDPYEREADHVADEVMRASEAQVREVEDGEGPAIQTRPITSPITPLIQRQGEDAALEVKDEEDEDESVQRSARMSPDGSEDPNDELYDQLNRARAGGTGLPEASKAEMEGAFGADFSSVRIHQDAQANTLARSFNAHAFATGDHIFFRNGAFNDASPSGRRLLAHELTHVVQQNPHFKGSPAVQRKPASAGTTLARVSRCTSSAMSWSTRPGSAPARYISSKRASAACFSASGMKAPAKALRASSVISSSLRPSAVVTAAKLSLR